MKKGFVVKHTLANKATGILLFLLPMAVLWEVIKVPYIVLVCLLATFAAVQEGHLIKTEQLINLEGRNSHLDTTQ